MRDVASGLLEFGKVRIDGGTIERRTVDAASVKYPRIVLKVPDSGTCFGRSGKVAELGCNRRRSQPSQSGFGKGQGGERLIGPAFAVQREFAVQTLAHEQVTVSVCTRLLDADENFPGAQIREFADNIRSSRPSGRRGTSEKKIPKEKLLAPYSSANRLASVGRELPPDVTRVDSNTGVSPLQGVLTTPQPLGGQAKAPQLLVSSAPIYPTMARQAHVEGQVTIEAVIDATGKLTNMTVVSGPPLLQQAAIDSLRTWKYQPGYLNEKPVPTKTSITVNFRLR